MRRIPKEAYEIGAGFLAYVCGARMNAAAYNRLPRGVLDCLERIHAQPGKNAVLIFLPGKGELTAFADIVHKVFDAAGLNQSSVQLVFIHGQTDAARQAEAFRPPPRPSMRKVVIATNVAETSVTIPGVVIVIDFCLVKVCDTRAQSYPRSLLSSRSVM